MANTDSAPMDLSDIMDAADRQAEELLDKAMGPESSDDGERYTEERKRSRQPETNEENDAPETAEKPDEKPEAEKKPPKVEEKEPEPEPEPEPEVVFEEKPSEENTAEKDTYLAELERLEKKWEESTREWENLRAQAAPPQPQYATPVAQPQAQTKPALDTPLGVNPEDLDPVTRAIVEQNSRLAAQLKELQSFREQVERDRAETEARRWIDDRENRARNAMADPKVKEVFGEDSPIAEFARVIVEKQLYQPDTRGRYEPEHLIVMRAAKEAMDLQRKIESRFTKTKVRQAGERTVSGGRSRPAAPPARRGKLYSDSDWRDGEAVIEDTMRYLQGEELA